MIDVENEIYTPIAEALREQFPGISVSGEYVLSPPGFPFVNIIEQDNYTTNDSIDSSDTEKFATLMYEVNVYSNKSAGRKSQCRAIMRVIDAMMYARNFKRTAMTPVPNMENATIYRLVARYRGETDGRYMYRR